MPKLRVQNFSISFDGYAAGPDQSMDQPLGTGGEQLHEWATSTRSWRRAHGLEGGSGGVDDDFAARGTTGIGATIMGRNMFGPPPGGPDRSDWRGWWGDEPPFRHPVFVLTHDVRPPIEMAGGTTFHFVSDDIEVVLERAFEAAAGADVCVGGGAATIQQYLRAGLVDDLQVAIVPVLLGAGERLFDNLDGGLAGYECVEFTATAAALHARFTREPEQARG